MNHWIRSTSYWRMIGHVKTWLPWVPDQASICQPALVDLQGDHRCRYESNWVELSLTQTGRTIQVTLSQTSTLENCSTQCTVIALSWVLQALYQSYLQHPTVLIKKFINKVFASKRVAICFWLPVPRQKHPTPSALFQPGIFAPHIFRFLFSRGQQKMLQEIHN